MITGEHYVFNSVDVQPLAVVEYFDKVRKREWVFPTLGNIRRIVYFNDCYWLSGNILDPCCLGNVTGKQR